MKGYEIKEAFKDLEVSGNLEAEVKEIKYDSRKVGKGDIFVALVNGESDGHKFVYDAILRGATGVIIQEDIDIPPDVLVIKAKDTKIAFAKLSSFIFGYPDRKLKVVGITGTMGKTSISYLLYRLFNYAGIKSAFIGTIGLGSGDTFELLDLSPPTTPFPYDLHRFLRTFVDNGIKYVFMEVSSHGIKDKRISGIDFYKKILGTMGIDHMDYHKTPEDYINTKVSFFEGSKSPVLNRDALWIDRFIKVSECPVFYGQKDFSDFYYTNIESDFNRVSFDVFESKRFLGHVTLPLLGTFNATNFMAVLSFARLEGMDFGVIKEFGKCAKIPGRMDIFEKNGIQVVIDFAHNPDEIKTVLEHISKYVKGQLTAVFGAVGTSSREKRVEMGKVVSNYASSCIITSDDPRGEALLPILKDIESGVTIPYRVMEDRKSAIREAILHSKRGDTVAILGRGVESKMTLKGGVELHFRDEDVVKELFNEM